MHWIIELLVRTRRLRGLSESQIRDLIEIANDKESLKVLKEHLESGSFRFPHLETKAKTLIEQITAKAKELEWQEHARTLKQEFLEKIGDLI
jgi:uncharacterized Rmd1/YagE family protein